MRDLHRSGYAKPPSLFSPVLSGTAPHHTVGIPEPPQASRHRVKLLSLVIDRGSLQDRIGTDRSKTCRDLDLYDTSLVQIWKANRTTMVIMYVQKKKKLNSTSIRS